MTLDTLYNSAQTREETTDKSESFTAWKMLVMGILNQEGTSRKDYYGYMIQKKSVACLQNSRRAGDGRLYW